MNGLYNNKSKILDLKSKIENNYGLEFLYNHVVIENNKINSKTLSIVMTSNNRSKQVYFTLDRISKSVIKDVHIVLVDDSTTDPIDISVLKKYEFYIDFIHIYDSNKIWNNPCVNYNIAFKYVKGSKVIIQNSEVCHVGDVLKFVYDQVITGNYYCFDVATSLNYETNNFIYIQSSLNTDIYKQNLFSDFWYQSQNHSRNYHFLTACTIDTFSKIDTFSYDYSLGRCFDDDDYLLKIRSNKINLVDIYHDKYYIGGIHLYHGVSASSTPNINGKFLELNESIFKCKLNIYNISGHYIDILNYDEMFILDVNFYKDYYDDLKHLSDEGLIEHWNNYGINEGRICNPKVLNL
jgi:glycosyltransferase involved in cell wall biosynthesis